MVHEDESQLMGFETKPAWVRTRDLSMTRFSVSFEPATGLGIRSRVKTDFATWTASNS